MAQNETVYEFNREREKLVYSFFEIARSADKLDDGQRGGYQEALLKMSEQFPIFSSIGKDGRAIAGVKGRTAFSKLIVLGLIQGLEFNSNGTDPEDLREIRAYIGILIYSALDEENDLRSCGFEIGYENGISILAQAIEGLNMLSEYND